MQEIVTTLHTLEPYYGWITALALSPGGRFLGCATSRQPDAALTVVELWDLHVSRHCVLCSLEGTDAYGRLPQVGVLAWSHNGDFVALSRDDGVLQVWHVSWDAQAQPASPVASLRLEDKPLALAWSQQTLRCAAATRETLLFWEAGGGFTTYDYPPDERARSYYHRDAVRALAFSPDNRLLVTGDEGGNLVLWNVEDSIPRVVTWWVFSSMVRDLSLAWSPGSERILANGHWSDDAGFEFREETAIRFVQTEHMLHLSTDTTRISDLIGWSPDGSLFAATRFEDRSVAHRRFFVELWESLTGDLHARYELSPVTLPLLSGWSVNSFQGVFSSDGQHIIWCAEIRAWPYQAGEAAPLLWCGSLALAAPTELHPN